MKAYKSLFQRDETYLSEIAFFDELAEVGEIALAQPQDVPLVEWEVLKE